MTDESRQEGLFVKNPSQAGRDETMQVMTLCQECKGRHFSVR